MVKVKIDMSGWIMSEHGVTNSRLTVVRQTEDYVYPNGKRIAQWICECNCKEHNQVITTGTNLRRGHTLSCGCLQKEIAARIQKQYNKYDLSGEYGIGYVSTGEQFLFDLDDYDKIKDFCWHIDKHGYVVTNRTNNYHHIKLHRLIMDASRNMHVDHRRGNKLDNRKSELRICTASENNRNKGTNKNNISGYKGVYWDNKHQEWRAQITVNYKTIALGRFTDKNDAIVARLKAEEKYFGEYRYGTDETK